MIYKGCTMTKKQILFTIITFVSTNSFSFDSSFVNTTHCNMSIPTISPQGDFVFDRGGETKINGNNIRKYFRFKGYQENPTPVFQYIRVIEVTKDKDFQEIGTIGAGIKRKKSYEKFRKHIKMNNAIYCDDVEEVEDYDGNMHSIGAIVYGTQNLKNCPLVREFIALQKLAAEKNKAAESAAPAVGTEQK